jgi:nucleoside-diphosphate-sugar epimerase
MIYFVTGATGFIGERLALRLAKEGHRVHALIRSKTRAAKLTHPNILFFEGDLLNSKSIDKAMKGCGFAFHLAAYARVWSKDKSWPEKINVQGAVNVFESALKHRVQRVVFTSTGGTLEPSDGNQPVSEITPRTVEYFNAYESTKAEAEKQAAIFTEKGLEVVTVNPTRVYGPELISDSNAMTKIIKQFNAGTWRIIPGDGSKYGNYVYVDDVVEGHLLAMKKGKPGERYIIGGENASYEIFFDKLKKITGKRQLLFHVPYRMMYFSGLLQYYFSQITGRPPLITPRWIKKYLHHWAVSSEKAEKELGYKITSLDEGLKKTVNWLNHKTESTA